MSRSCLGMSISHASGTQLHVVAQERNLWSGHSYVRECTPMAVGALQGQRHGYWVGESGAAVH